MFKNDITFKYINNKTVLEKWLGLINTNIFRSKNTLLKQISKSIGIKNVGIRNIETYY